MIKTQVEIVNKLGLHARAAAKLVDASTSYNCDIRLANGQQVADGKNIMSLLMLAAAKGTTLELTVNGECTQEEEAACQAITDLIRNRFEEAE